VPVTHLFAGIPTADFAAALDWYERLLGGAPDRFPHDTEAVWQLVDNGLVYVVLDHERAGNALLTLIVDDVDGWAEQARRRGVAVPEIAASPGLRRTGFDDPDGNRIQIAQIVVPQPD
jgi:catechol 2,3-dioxygenase-like lactoylglutathione lyase family enzyme